MKEQRLAIRKEDHKSQEAAVLDRLRLSYDSLSSNNKATNAESGQMGVDLQHQPLSTPQDIPSILGALTSLRNQKIGDSSLQIYRLEYQKNCHSLGLFFFAFLAFPLGIGSKRQDEPPALVLHCC